MERRRDPKNWESDGATDRGGCISSHRAAKRARRRGRRRCTRRHDRTALCHRPLRRGARNGTRVRRRRRAGSPQRRLHRDRRGTVRETLAFAVGANTIPRFALESGGRGRTLHAFRCVFSDCLAFFWTSGCFGGTGGSSGLQWGSATATAFLVFRRGCRATPSTSKRKGFSLK